MILFTIYFLLNAVFTISVARSKSFNVKTSEEVFLFAAMIVFPVGTIALSGSLVLMLLIKGLNEVTSIIAQGFDYIMDALEAL